MSNIVKQYSVVQEEKKIRVINNNASIKKLVRSSFEPATVQKVPQQSIEPESDLAQGEPEEFAEGIQADVVADIDIEAEKEKLLSEAKAQADEIIKNANADAQKLLDEAKQRAQILYADNKAKGYEDGLAEKEKDFADRTHALEQQFDDKKASLEAEYASYTEALESDLIDAIIKVFDKVFHIQFDDKKEILLHLVKNTISNIEVGKEFRIHVAHTNYKFMFSHIDEIRERIGNDIDIEIVNDANLDASGCQIETSFGVFDCGIDMELNNLVNDIKSLCS